MEGYKRLLLENKAWAQARASHAPEAEEAEHPEFLWIGCSDARVPAEQLTGAGPGELFVHRNVANLVVATDANLAAVLECAVAEIGVPHVIVCGHHDCHGVRAAMSRTARGMLNPWLTQVRDTWQTHRSEIGMHEAVAAERRLVELNVLQQVQNLAKTEIVQRSWAEHRRPMLHGWVYDHADDLIKPLVKVDADTPLDEAYRFQGLEAG